MNAEQKRAYEWAINQDYQSVAARYAKTLAEMVESLQAQLELRAQCADAADTIYKKQLAESQRREKAAVEMLQHDCVNCKYTLFSGACKLIPDGDEFSPDYVEGFDRDDCERWQWRGPVEGGEGE